VLVADDSVSVRRVAELMLRNFGCEAVLAVDGEDALAKLRQERVALVLTDLEMPKLTGYDLLREIRSHADWQDLPVVVVTSRSGDKHRQLAHELGASGYLPKPFTIEQLSDVVAAWVRR
jgi:chemosensory pili system protein ChpA (sensor histidine kinase/response regulator)